MDDPPPHAPARDRAVPPALAPTAARKSSQWAAYGAIAASRRSSAAQSSSASQPQCSTIGAHRPTRARSAAAPPAGPRARARRAGDRRADRRPRRRHSGVRWKPSSPTDSGPPQTTAKRRASTSYCSASKRLYGGTNTCGAMPEWRELGERRVEQLLGRGRRSGRTARCGGAASRSACGGRARAGRMRPPSAGSRASSARSSSSSVTPAALPRDRAARG